MWIEKKWKLFHATVFKKGSFQASRWNILIGVPKEPKPKFEEVSRLPLKPIELIENNTAQIEIK